MPDRKLGHMRTFQPSYILFVLVSAIIAVLICVPIGYMLFESFTTEAGNFTLVNFQKYYGKGGVVEALANTLLVGIGIGVLGSLIGVTLAYGVSRTNMRFKTLVKSTIIVAIMTPPFLITLAYIILGGPNMGYVNQALRLLFHLKSSYGPIDIYSVWSLVILGLPQGIATIFMMVFPALENMDPYLEEAGRMCGASSRRTAMQITIPLVKPAVLSGLMLAFGQSLALYGVPRMLNINVLTTKIRESITVMDFKLGAVLSATVTVLSMLAVFLYRRTIRSNKKYSTISAKGFRPAVMKLGKSRYLFSLLGLIYACFGFLIPYVILLIASFMKSVGNGFMPDNFTLGNYLNLMQSAVAKTAFKNSMYLGFMTATCVVSLGLVSAYVVVRLKVRGRGLLEYLSNMSSGISGTALAMGLIFMYLSFPLNRLHLYGTLGLLLVAYVTRMLPSGARYCQSALIQINTELEEASRISGASWSRTLVNVTIPLAKTGLIYAWILTFVMAFPELSSSIMLRNAGTDVVATAILDLWDGAGGLNQAAAFGTVVFMIVTALVVLAQKLSGRSLLDRSK
jgi:iron(III) transport system permease protein